MNAPITSRVRWVLRCGEQGIGLVDRVVFGQRGARFHGIRHQAVVAHLKLDNRRGHDQRGLGGGSSPSSKSKYMLFGTFS